MRDGGRLSAAIAVLDDMEARHKPVHLALRAWGDSARYAGAKDRAAVSGLVLDMLRHYRSTAWQVGDKTNRARALGVLRFHWAWPSARIAEAAADQHGPGPLTDGEAAALETPASLDDAPPDVRGDYASWLDAPLQRAFGASRAAEAAALADRAPVDLRVNALRADPAKVMAALSALPVEAGPFLPNALRLPAPDAAERAAPVEASPVFEKGWFEVQDIGSQIAAACAGDIKGAQVLDYCAGGGGKTLALAAAMGNSGQLYAYDSDPRRLKDTVTRAQRAGVRNLQIRSPLEKDPLRGLAGQMDLVFVDAPCTGSGTWRRHPDTKWRLSERQLEARVTEQTQILEAASAYVKPGGRLIYVTCSLFVEENEDRVAAFLESHSDFSVDPIPLETVQPFLTPEGYLRLSPLRSQTDGFFVAALRRS